MDQTQELLKASFERLEGLIDEVRDLRFKVKDVQGDIDSMRSSLKEDQQGGGEGQNGGQNQQGQKGQQNGGDRQGAKGGKGGGDDDRLTKIEDRLEYLADKWMELDQEIFKLKKKKNNQ